MVTYNITIKETLPNLQDNYYGDILRLLTPQMYLEGITIVILVSLIRE